MSAKNEELNFHNINIIDANLFKKNKKLQKDTITDDIIKAFVLLHKKTDDGLKELSEMCLKNKDGK
jgi:hypothetical protein